MDFKLIAIQVAQYFNKLGKRQKIISAASVVLVVGFLVFLSIFRSSDADLSGWAVLFDGSNPSENAMILAQLEKDGVKYKLKDENTILVPKEKVYAERISIASLGILKDNKVGFELYDKQEFGSTEEEQKIKYKRAIEGELARTIESLEPISKAVVHIAFEKDSLFVRDKTPPSASLVLTLAPGKNLSPKQIFGIKALVAASINGLDANEVKLVDQRGIALGGDADDVYDADFIALQVRYKKDFEHNLESKIISVLAPLVGSSERVVAKVTASFDFSQEESRQEALDPNTIAISENILEEKREGKKEAEVGGVPGAISNIGPVQGIEGSKNQELYSKNQSIINYEASKKITNTKGQYAKLLRLSAAVVVDGKYVEEADKLVYKPQDEETLTQMKALVNQAIGFNAQRSDEVSISSLQFIKESIPLNATQQVQAFIIGYLNPLAPILKYLLAAFVLFIFYRKVIVPFFEKMTTDASATAEDLSEVSSIQILEEDENLIEKAREARRKVEKQLGLDGEFNEGELQYDVLLERAKNMGIEKHQEIALLIENLLRNDNEFQANKDMS